MSETLDVDLIHRFLSDDTRQLLDRLDVLAEVPSTNSWLMQRAAREAGRFEVVLAEHQTAGRGRRERCWQSPPGTGLCLSMAYTFPDIPRLLPALSLVVGVAVAQALEVLGAQGHKLKWPNDLMAGDGKLGGILVEALTGSGSAVGTVIGIGLNVDVRAALAAQDIGTVEQPVADLRRVLEPLPARAVIAAAIIDAVQRSVLRFESGGLEAFRLDWNKRDWLRGREVVVHRAAGAFAGTADGIDDGGALRVLTAHGRQRVFSGSVRLAGHAGSVA